MTAHYADFGATPGLVFSSVTLFAVRPTATNAAAVKTASAVAEHNPGTGTFRATFADVPAGVYLLRGIAGGILRASWYVEFAGTADEIAVGRLDYEQVGGSGETVVSVTVPRSVAADSQDPDVITAVRAATLRRSLPAVGSLIGIEELWLTVKRSLDDLDADALIQMQLTIGLVRLNGEAATAGDGSLTITDSDVGNVDWYVKAAAMAQLPLIQGAHFDLKGRFSGSGDVVVLIDDGTFNLTSEVTNAT